jgi:hypothetical protein
MRRISAIGKRGKAIDENMSRKSAERHSGALATDAAAVKICVTSSGGAQMVRRILLCGMQFLDVEDYKRVIIDGTEVRMFDQI